MLTHKQTIITLEDGDKLQVRLVNTRVSVSFECDEDAPSLDMCIDHGFTIERDVEDVGDELILEHRNFVLTAH